MTDFNNNTVLWSLDEFIKFRKDEIRNQKKENQMANRGKRQSAHLQTYKDADFFEDEDDDGDFNIRTLQSDDVDDATHAANMNQLNFEKNDFDQIMYNDLTEANEVNSSTGGTGVPPSRTPPRPSVKSRLGVKSSESWGNRGKQTRQGAIKKRGKGYPNKINNRNNSMENNNQNRVSANFQRGVDAFNKFREHTPSFGQPQNLLDSTNNNFHIELLDPNGPSYNESSNTNNLHFNRNSMIRSNHTNTSESNSYCGILANNPGSVNSNTLLPNYQGFVYSNRVGGMQLNNQEHVYSNSYGGLLSNNQEHVNSNIYRELFPKEAVNSNSSVGLLSNNQEHVNSNIYRELFPKEAISSNSSVGLLSNNLNTHDGIGINNPRTTRRDIIANNWKSSVESNNQITPNTFQNRPEPLVKGNLEPLLTVPKSGMFVGQALGISLSDCQKVDVHTIAQNVLFLLATAENDSQSKSNYGVHDNKASQ